LWFRASAIAKPRIDAVVSVESLTVFTTPLKGGNRMETTASGVGVGSNPTAALALFALLVAIRFVGEQIKGGNHE